MKKRCGCDEKKLVREDIINEIANECHSIAKSKGWWDSDRSDGECIALMHSELSEALEKLRKPQKDEHLPHLDSVGIEMADCIIRIFDYCGKKGINIGKCLIEKMEFNKTRPYKHGKKF